MSDGVPVNNWNVHTEPQNEDAADEKMSDTETENERELEGVEQPASIGNSAQEVERRYPLRDRKAKEYNT